MVYALTLSGDLADNSQKAFAIYFGLFINKLTFYIAELIGCLTGWLVGELCGGLVNIFILFQL